MLRVAFLIVAGVLGLASGMGCSNSADVEAAEGAEKSKGESSPMGGYEGEEMATFGGGCFWCLEAAYERLKGVSKVESGYSGGTKANPTYEEVCSGQTGHAEVVQVSFDPEVIAYEDLLDVFFTIHDPTTLNRQGADVGTQYRSVIFYHGDAQKTAAEKKMRELEAAKKYSDQIVTELKPMEKFYKAEPYHQEYYRNNPKNSYCRFVIDPKIQKLQKEHGEMLR